MSLLIRFAISLVAVVLSGRRLLLDRGADGHDEGALHPRGVWVLILVMGLVGVLSTLALAWST